MGRRIFRNRIPATPNCSHHRLVTLCGGNVRERIFQGFEHLLRMVANFESGQIALAIRYLFDPHSEPGAQDRLKIEVAAKIDDAVSADTVRQLIEFGPLQEFYDFNHGSEAAEEYPLPTGYTAVCEVIRQEERVQPLVNENQNRKIPKLYYSLQAFEAREDNDYLMLDALLSRVTEPCAVEFLVRSVDHVSDLEAHYKYICQLMSINQYWDDLPGAGNTGALYRIDSSGEKAKLEERRVRDPMADEILREQEDVHKVLRQPQLLFHVKTFATHAEQAMMLASMVAESAISEGKYRIIAYGSNDGSGRKDWFRTSLEDSGRMEVSTDAMYPGIWEAELPKVWHKLRRLCRLASVNELKGLFRLPVGGYGSPRCIRKSTDPRAKKLEQELGKRSDAEKADVANLRKAGARIDTKAAQQQTKAAESGAEKDKAFIDLSKKKQEMDRTTGERGRDQQKTTIAGARTRFRK